MNSKELEEIDNKVLKLLESKDWKSKWLPHNSEIRQIFVTRTPFEYYKILLSNPSYTEEELLERQIHSASVDDEEDFMQGFDNEKEYLAVFCISKNLELDIPF